MSSSGLLHGDVVADTDATSAAASTNWYAESTEFGVPRSTSASARFAWLGGKRRSTASEGDLVLMGKRTYNPGTGRFMEVDPIPGGSATAFDYADQNPIGNFDLDGTIATASADGRGQRFKLYDCVLGKVRKYKEPEFRCKVRHSGGAVITIQPSGPRIIPKEKDWGRDGLIGKAISSIGCSTAAYASYDAAEVAAEFLGPLGGFVVLGIACAGGYFGIPDAP